MNTQQQQQADTTSEMTTKFWGIWLPVPTVIAIINSLFWTWLLFRTVGPVDNPIEKSASQIIDFF